MIWTDLDSCLDNWCEWQLNKSISIFSLCSYPYIYEYKSRKEEYKYKEYKEEYYWNIEIEKLSIDENLFLFFPLLNFIVSLCFFIIIVIINYSLNFQNKIIFDSKTKRKVKSSSSLRILFFLTREILLYRQEVKTGWNVGQQVSFFLNEITNDTKQDVPRGNWPFEKEKKKIRENSKRNLRNMLLWKKTFSFSWKPFLRKLKTHT